MSKLTTLENPVVVQDWSLEEIGRSGNASIGVHVHGYWADVITVRVSRDFSYERGVDGEYIDTSKFAFSVSHSSGGRDTGEVADDLEAEALFARGLLAAVATAHELRNREPELVAMYEAERVAYKAAQEAERAAAQARIDADPAVDLNMAKHIVKQLWARAELDGLAELNLYARGSDTHFVNVCVSKARHSGVITARFNGERCGRLDLPGRLVTLSRREHKLPA